MNIDENTLRNLLIFLDTTEKLAREYVTYQAILEQRVPNWRNDYDRLKTDEAFQKHLTITLADLLENRRQFYLLVEAYKAGSTPASSGQVQ